MSLTQRAGTWDEGKELCSREGRTELKEGQTWSAFCGWVGVLGVLEVLHRKPKLAGRAVSSWPGLNQLIMQPHPASEGPDGKSGELRMRPPQSALLGPPGPAGPQFAHLHIKGSISPPACTTLRWRSGHTPTSMSSDGAHRSRASLAPGWAQQLWRSPEQHFSVCCPSRPTQQPGRGGVAWLGWAHGVEGQGSGQLGAFCKSCSLPQEVFP